MANADPAEAENGDMVTISVSSESGLTSVMADASAIGGDAAVALSEGMDADMAGTGVYSGMVTVAGVMESGAKTITITASDAIGNASEPAMATVNVDVEPRIRDVAVDNEVVKQGSTIMVSVTGRAGGGTVTIMDSAGAAAVTAKALDPVGDPDAEGDQAYTRSITLPAVLADGMYTVSAEIQGEMDSSTVEVLNDQSPPTLSDASAWPAMVANGGQVALRVTVTPNASMVEIATVTADVSALDSTQTDPIALDALASEAGTYAAFFTISADNMAADGAQTVSFTATDRLDNASEAATASITLRNDVTPPVLSMESAMPSSAVDGTMVTISVSSESGLTVTADASAIGGGMVTLNGPMMDCRRQRR